MADEPNLYDRLHAAEGAGHRPNKWVGSTDTGEIGWLTLTPDGVFIEGVQVLVAGEPIRVETLADDSHIVHLGLFVRQVIHDPRIGVQTVRTFSPPSTPTPLTQEPAMPEPMFREGLPVSGREIAGDNRLQTAFARAVELANAQGSATVGYRDGDADSDAETGYDVTVVRIGGPTPGDSTTTATTPTVGLRVLYTLTEADAAAINKRRADYAAFTKTLDGQPEPGARGATGHVAHVGNRAEAGAVCSADVVQVFGGHAANLQVVLDGVDSYWATSRCEGDGPGFWVPLPAAQ